MKDALLVAVPVRRSYSPHGIADDSGRRHAVNGILSPILCKTLPDSKDPKSLSPSQGQALQLLLM